MGRGTVVALEKGFAADGSQLITINISMAGEGEQQGGEGGRQHEEGESEDDEEGESEEEDDGITSIDDLGERWHWQQQGAGGRRGGRVDGRVGGREGGREESCPS